MKDIYHVLGIARVSAIEDVYDAISSYAEDEDRDCDQCPMHTTCRSLPRRGSTCEESLWMMLYVAHNNVSTEHDMLHNAIENCHMSARRGIASPTVAIAQLRNIVRFCEEAGVTLDILRTRDDYGVVHEDSGSR